MERVAGGRVGSLGRGGANTSLKVSDNRTSQRVLDGLEVIHDVVPGAGMQVPKRRAQLD
jgi:hypothetical protein